MAEISTILWDVGGVLLTNGWDHLERTAVLQQFALDAAPSSSGMRWPMTHGKRA